MGGRRCAVLALVALTASIASPIAVRAGAATPEPTLTVGDVAVPEGDSGKVTVHVPFHLDRPAPSKTYVHWRVTAGSATAGTDFVSPLSGVRSGTAAIGAGALDGSVGVQIKGDTVAAEGTETVAVDVTDAGAVAVARTHGTVSIVNDDTGGPTGTVRVATGTPVVWEGDTGVRHALVPVVLSQPAPAALKVRVAVAGTDSTSLNGDSCHDLNVATVKASTVTVSFLAGQQSKQVRVGVRGNVGQGPALVAAPLATTLISGSATVATPTDDVIIVDDDTSSGGVAPTVGTHRVSETADGGDPTFPPAIANTSNGCGFPQSTFAAVSGYGRYVAFSSNANNLVGNDTNGYDDAFVKDTWTGAVQLISAGPSGDPATDDSHVESISRDGRFVTFSSRANNLVPNDDNGVADSFLFDRQTAAMVRLGDSHVGSRGSSGASLSADDRMVVFTSSAPIGGQCSGCSSGIYVWDRTANTTTLVSKSATNAGAQMPAISGDGLHVAFLSLDILGRLQVYERDLASGTLSPVSVNDAGQGGSGIYGTMPDRPALSDDGQVVAFRGQYCNFGLASRLCGNADDTQNASNEIWVRDRVAGTTRLASVAPDGTPTSNVLEGPSISADGRYVIFDNDDTIAAPECAADGGQHVFERDLTAATTTRADVTSGSPPCMETAYPLSNAAVSADGSFVVYTAMAAAGDVSATNPEAIYLTRLP